MKKPLYLMLGVGLAAGMMAFKPAVTEGATVRSDEALADGCLYYYYWQYSGGTVTCYGPGGTACAVCKQ
ncbi:MAG: hypothetical protein U9Q74_00115 [Gemmatimonadota bacterium]|nr:hypothetical protein [Gemmatimonadota bacterium]